MEPLERMRRLVPDQFHSLVKMHLSFLLELNFDDCDCNFVYETTPPSTPSAKSKGSIFATPKMRKNSNGGGGYKGVMEGAPLTMEGVCQVSQIIEYLKRNLQVEGLFRKCGNLQKQKALSKRLNSGIPVDLDSGEFSVHEASAVLKTFLSELSEPLLTDAYYKAHCQVAQMDDDDSRKLQGLQLLLLLVPEANYVLIQDLLKLLSLVVDNVEQNKMNAVNLATVFATHILCPRKLAPDSLQENHQVFIKAVAYMIDNTADLFCMPPKLVKDVENFWSKNKDRDISALKVGPKSSPVVNTIYSFVDQQRTQAAASQSTTEVAIAELYAQIQKMPESAQKKKLIRSFNDANGMGTPSLANKKRGHDTSSKLKHLLTPRSKTSGTAKKQKKEGKNHGSYNLSSRAEKFDESNSTPVYKRQNSGKTPIMSTFTAADASPALKDTKPPPPPPPPRSSSLKKQDDHPLTDPLQTPRSRKPIFKLSPKLEAPPVINEFTDEEKESENSFIEKEANLLLTGKMNPSKSMTAFLNNENLPLESSDTQNTPDKLRKRSLTELGGPNPLVKNTSPLKNCQAYFETDF